MPISFDDLIPTQPRGRLGTRPAPLPPGFQLDQSQKPGMFDDIAPAQQTQTQQTTPQGMFDDLIPQPQAAPAASFADRFAALGPNAPQRQPASWGDTAEDVAKSAGVGLARGAIGIAGLPGDLANLASKAYDYVSGSNTNATVAPYANRIGGAALQHDVENLTGPFYQPQTTAGHYAQTVGEFAPAAIGGPEGLVGKLATRVIAPGLASEAAGEATQGTPYETAARIGGALLGSGGASALGGTLVNAAKESVPSIGEHFDAASAAYQSPEVQALRIAPQAMDDFVDNLHSTLLQNKVDPIAAPNVAGILDRLRTPRFDTNGTVADFDLARQSLSDAPYEERRAAGIARGAIDQYLGNVPQSDVVAGDADAANSALLDARGNYAAAKRAQDVSNALGRAENQAGSTYSGGNLDNATRQQLRPILNQKQGVSKVPGFQDYTPDELAALKATVNGNPMANAVRAAGKTLGSGGGLGNLSAGLTAGLGTHEAGGDWKQSALAGLGAMIGGRVLGGVANRMTAAEAQRMSDLLLSRSPLSAPTVARNAPLPAIGNPSLPQYGALGYLAARPQFPAAVNQQ